MRFGPQLEELATLQHVHHSRMLHGATKQEFAVQPDPCIPAQRPSVTRTVQYSLNALFFSPIAFNAPYRGS